MAHAYYDKDVKRHVDAVEVARRQSLINHRTEIWIAQSECGKIKVAEKILSRAPVARGNGHWNLPAGDLRVLQSLKEAGFVVHVLLYDEIAGRCEKVPLDEVVQRAKPMPGKPGQGEYYQFTV